MLICRYEDNLTFAKSVGTQKGLVLGMGIGLSWTIVFAIFAVSFYFGVILIHKGDSSPGNVLVVSVFVPGILCMRQHEQIRIHTNLN